MPTVLTGDANKAVEASTFVINAAFTDEDDAAVTPSSITWTLTDAAGNVINSRQDVVVDTPAASIDIVLFNADLAIAGQDRKRVLTVDAVYDSNAGSDLPLRDFVEFEIVDAPV